MACSFRLTAGEALWSASQVDQRIAEIERILERVPDGEPIALLMSTDGAPMAALLAAHARGRPTLLLPATIERAALGQLVDVVRPAMVVGPATGQWGEDLEGTRQRIDSRGMMLEFVQLWWRERHELPEDTSVLQLTSGSLSPARLAVRSRSGISDEISALDWRIGFGGERILCSSSLAHSYGSIAGLLAPAKRGAAEIAVAGSASEAGRLAAAVRPTIIIGLASTYRTFLDADLPAEALGAARVLLSAGAPLPSGLFDAFWQRFGFPIRQDYGTTETGTVAIDYPGQAEPNVVGAPLSHLQVRVSEQTVQPLDPGEQGEIQVRGVATVPRYLDAHGLHSVVDQQGWYHTGDVGEVTSDGNVRVVRRLRQPIHLGDTSVRPEKVEQAIARMPGVDEVAVIVTGSMGRAAVEAVVVADGLTLAQVRAWSRANLPATSVPRIITMRAALPRSPAGKVLYTRLRNQ
jgi:acyl-coenzyme A synthetase/AMP-(fatty) acid ligase